MLLQDVCCIGVEQESDIMSQNHVELVQEFIHCINESDIESLLDLMTPDHVFYVEGENPTSGKAAMREAWIGYFTAFPNYKIVVDELYDQGDKIFVIGHTSGSQVPPEIEETPSSVIWEAQIRDGLVAAWIIYDATQENRKRFNIPSSP